MAKTLCRQLERHDLDDHRGGFENEQSADDGKDDFRCFTATAMAPSAPPSDSEPVSPMRSWRRSVEPQESETGADQCATDDGKFACALDVVDLR